MKAIRVTCPNCGATLRVPEGATTIHCEYCGTPSAVQRRTRILERVVMPPSTLPTGMPRAVQRHSRWWLVFALVTVLAPIIVTGVVVATTIRRATSVEVPSSVTTRTPPVNPADRPPTWQGTDNVLVADVNRDGTPELIGRGRRVNGADAIMLLALDLATGKQVGQSEPLGTYSDTYRGSLVLAGDVILYASHEGEVRGYALADGKLLWKKVLDERVKYFCAGDDAATVNAIGADDVIRPIARATGAVGEKREVPKDPKRRRSPREEVCPPLPSDGITPFELAKRLSYYDDGKSQLGRKLDLYIDTIVVGPGGRVASGSKSKGTHVTTLVGLDDQDGERWRATASPDGLGAEGPPRTVVVGEREVCIVYYGKDYRTACFAMADGKRLWDAETPSFFEGLLIVGRSLVVTGNELRVHDLDTGNVRWRFE